MNKFCPSCGTTYPEGYSYCNQCGRQLPEKTATQLIASAAAAPSPALERFVSPETKDEQYANPTQPTVPFGSFVLTAIISILLLSCITFLVTQSWTINWWNSAIVAVPMLALAAVIALISGINKWQLIQPAMNGRGRKLAIALVFITFSFLLLSVLFGLQLGGARAKRIKLESDWRHYAAIGQRISSQRDQVKATIPAYLEMYKNISADVRDFRGTVAQLLLEEKEYGEEHPEYQDHMEEELGILRVAEKRGALLQKQVDIAEKISAQDESLRGITWSVEMRPALEEEITLDKKN